MVGIALIGTGAIARGNFVQDRAQFRASLDNRSTSPSFVLITVIDGRSGARRTGCTMAGFLLHAIAAEEGIDRTDAHGIMAPDAAARARAKALASSDHVYTFRKREALAAVPTDGVASDRACAILRGGQPAYMQDRSGRISPGWPLGAEPIP